VMGQSIPHDKGQCFRLQKVRPGINGSVHFSVAVGSGQNIP
jgi:hypothetical protein